MDTFLSNKWFVRISCLNLEYQHGTMWSHHSLIRSTSILCSKHMSWLGKSMHLQKRSCISIDEYSTLSETKVAWNRKRVESWNTSFLVMSTKLVLYALNQLQSFWEAFWTPLFSREVPRLSNTQYMELVVVSAQVVFSAGFLKRHLSWSQFCGVLRLAIFVRCLKNIR